MSQLLQSACLEPNEIHSGRLSGAHSSDLTFRNEAAKIDQIEIDQRHNGSTRRYNFTRFRTARHYSSVEGGNDLQIVTVGLRNFARVFSVSARAAFMSACA